MAPSTCLRLVRDTFPPLAVGQSLIAASLPGIGQIRGIIIDNPSGQWLYVLPAYDYVPPYTLGWSRSFPGGTVTIEVRAGVAPAGQVSTQQGDSVTITIDENPVGTSQGAATGQPFIQQFTPILTAMQQIICTSQSPGISVDLVVGVANKRTRIWSLEFTYTYPDASQGYWQDSGVNVQIMDTIGFGNTYAIAMLSRETPTVSRVYPQGLDFPIAENVVISGNGVFADVPVNVVATYSVI